MMLVQGHLNVFLIVAIITGLMVQTASSFEFSYVALSPSSVSINFNTICPKFIDLYVMERVTGRCAHHIAFDCPACLQILCTNFTEVFPLPTACLAQTVLERNRSLDNIIHVVTGLNTDVYVFRFVQHFSNSTYRAKSVVVRLPIDDASTMTTKATKTTKTKTTSPLNPVFVQQPVTFEFDIPMGVKLNATFDPDLKGEYTRRFKTELGRIFVNVTGLLDVFGVNVSKGSIQCEFWIKLDGKKIAVPSQLMREINETVLWHLEVDGLDGHAVYMDYLRMRLRRFQEELELVWLNTCPWTQCPHGYQCRNPGITKAFCVHQCDDECMKHGECLLDEYWAAKCRCKDDDDFHYTGENCQIRQEKMDFTWNQILIIGGSVGGSLCLTCIVLMACLCTTKRKRQHESKHVPRSNASTNSIHSYRTRNMTFKRHSDEMESDWRRLDSGPRNSAYLPPNIIPIKEANYLTPIVSNRMAETSRSWRPQEVPQRPRAPSRRRPSIDSMTSSDAPLYVPVCDVDMKASLDSSASSAYMSNYF